MAVRAKRNGLVSLVANERVIGVVLERTIFGDVKVRPTNVTATMSSAPAHSAVTSLAIAAGTIGTAETTDAGGFGNASAFLDGNTNSLRFTANAALLSAPGAEFTVGTLIRITSGTNTATATLARVTSNTTTRQSFFVDQIRTVGITILEQGSTPISGLTNASVISVIRAVRNGGTFSAGSLHTIPFATSTDFHDYNPGDFIRISRGTNSVRATIIDVSAGHLHVRVDEVFTGPLTVTQTQTVTVLLLEEQETDYILLHNGPKGGFSQEFVGVAGDYFVNDVIKALVTTA